MEPGTLKIRDKIDLVWLALFDCFGTFLLLTAVQLSNGQDAGAPEVCATLFLAGCLCARISGAHFNGAVTLCVYLIEGKWKANLKIAITLFVADLLGVNNSLLYLTNSSNRRMLDASLAISSNKATPSMYCSPSIQMTVCYTCC